MGLPGIHTGAWTLLICLSWGHVRQALAGPQYMVVCPAVLQAGVETKLCASLLQPNESLVMTVTLMSEDSQTVLLETTTDEDFHTCIQFQAPSVKNKEVQSLAVAVKGDTFYSTADRRVLFQPYVPMTFVQTDKPIYLPGQTGNLTNTLSLKILQLSYSLNSEAGEGTYSINVKTDTQEIKHDFKVEAYVLPRFEVQLSTLDEISTLQNDLKVDVCARYTFGQPVSGMVIISFQVNNGLLYFSWPHNHSFVSHFISPFQMKPNGCATFNVDKTFSKMTLMFFIDTPSTYVHGSIVEGKVKAVHYNNSAAAGIEVKLLEAKTWARKLLQTLKTDEEGIAAFSLNTSDFQTEIKLWVSPHILLYIEPKELSARRRTEASLHVLHPTSSRRYSSFTITTRNKLLRCDAEETISIQYSIIGEEVVTVDVIHLVSGGEKLEKMDVGEVSFQFKVSPDMSPGIQVVAYASLPSEKVVTQNAEFSTETCFNHKVSLEFSSMSAVPGEDTTMQMIAQPDSLCGVNIVDQSVLIKEPGKILDADKVFNLLPAISTNVPTEVQDYRSCFQVSHISLLIFFFFFCLKMVTNLQSSYSEAYKRRTSHKVCVGISGRYSNNFRMSKEELPPVETIRSFFPETWIWDLVEIGDSGRKDVPLKVPDTITTWETEAFCLSSQGFGLAPRQNFTVFQPFFLELTMPYSVIRGENFELKATIFSYLISCIMVSVTPSPSSDYTLTPLSDDQYTSCLCGSERKTLSWTMTPSALGTVNVSVHAEAVPSSLLCGNDVVEVPERGRVDVVTRSLVIKAEGTEVSKTFNWLLCPKGDVLTEETELQLPWNLIEGSARASVSVLGDILGRALENLDQLLKMPFGCGEQNMVLLAPNIYILLYLENTKQLTPAIRSKATNFMISGYQRQLNYKLSNGAYSTFGSNPGITWLTAFVLRCFVRAQSFIYIDPKNIEEAKTWLMSKQQPNGCFEMSGKLFHNLMKGGVSDEVTLSAYITAAFLEMKTSADDPVVVRSLACLKESMSDLSNTYTTALMAYVFTLAGDTETRNHLLQHLDSVAVREGNSLHWSQKAAETSASLSVEISSYVLLAKLSSSPTDEDAAHASEISRWLIGQQNSYGGFTSTQDTVVALQALALYATVVYSLEGSSTVTVQAPSGALLFEVNPDNKLLYQERALQDVTGNFSLEAKGSACAAVQISLHYNIPTPIETSAFVLMVKATPQCSSNSETPRLSLEIVSLYRGKEDATNMVILDIKALSGFVPDTQSVKKLRHHWTVDRVDQKDDHILVYLRELKKDMAVSHTLELIQEVPVKNLKPAVVKIYDYYQPSKKKLIIFFLII
uniref:Alpha-2-macroglobulin domain-containing protein n=1 Tax=Salarias fasciatus TaxID=181472 RepID=A0A672JGL1_SALFA